MAGFLENVGLLISASLNEMVENALKAKSPAVLGEYIRRAQDNLDKLDETIAQITADRRIQKRKLEGLVADIASLEEQKVTLAKAKKMDLAGQAIAQRNVKQQAQASTETTIAGLDKDLAQLTNARAALATKIEQLKTAREQVELALQAAQSKRVTVDTIEDVAKVLDTDGYETFVSAAMREAEVQDVRLERTLSKHEHLLDPAQDPAVAAELAELETQYGESTEAPAAAAGAETYRVTIEKE